MDQTGMLLHENPRDVAKTEWRLHHIYGKKLISPTDALQKAGRKKRIW